MTKYRLVYLLALLGLAVLTICYQSRLSVILLLTFAAMPVVTLMLLLISFLCVKITVVPSNAVVQKNQSLTAELRVTNRFIIPLAPVRIFGMFQDDKNIRLERKQILLSVPPLKTVNLSFGGAFRYRGQYFIGAERAEFVDLLKIWRITKHLTPSSSVVVLPRRLELSNSADAADSDMEHFLSRFSAYEKNSFSSIREYREGDSLRAVHWKLSAKSEELIVRELEQNVSSNAVIFCDLSGNSDISDISMGQVDTAIETALAITKACISEGNTAVNVWFSADEQKAVSCISDTTADYERQFYLYSVAKNHDADIFSRIAGEFADLCSGSETVYIITSRIDEALAENLKASGINLRSVKLLSVCCPLSSTAEYLRADTLAQVYEISEDNLVKSIETAIHGSKS